VQLQHDDHAAAFGEAKDGIDLVAQMIDVDDVWRGLEVVPRDRQPDDVHAP
jgi:hypothetical protein